MEYLQVMEKEYGGYLPLELEKRNEYYRTNTDYEVRKYNSGRCAIYKAVKDSHATRVWLPVYLCNTVSDFLLKKVMSVEYYNIGHDFLPENIQFEQDDIVVWTTYFGVENYKQITEVIGRYQNLVIDNTQSFYIPPQKNVYNVYSCRKFFGVPDGSYLISNSFSSPDEKLPYSDSKSTARYLVDSIETSTNEAYSESLENEDRITNEDVMAMSHFTERILASIDYEKNQQVRLKNYSVYNSILGELNEIKVSKPEYAPMIYPLLVKSDSLRSELVSRRVYIPQWWKAVIEDYRSNEWERYLSRYVIPLPIDQRYNPSDMEYISKLITTILNRV